MGCDVATNARPAGGPPGRLGQLRVPVVFPPKRDSDPLRRASKKGRQQSVRGGGEYRLGFGADAIDTLRASRGAGRADVSASSPARSRGRFQCFAAPGCRRLELRLTESGLNAFRLNARSSTFTRRSAERAGGKSACSLRVPLGASGLARLPKALETRGFSATVSVVRVELRGPGRENPEGEQALPPPLRRPQ